MLFVIHHHWIALRRINKATLYLKCVSVLRRSARSTNHENVDTVRDLSLMTVEEVRGNRSESQDIEFQCNMAYEVRGNRSESQDIEFQSNMAYEVRGNRSESQDIEFQSNVAYEVRGNRSESQDIEFQSNMAYEVRGNWSESQDIEFQSNVVYEVRGNRSESQDIEVQCNVAYAGVGAHKLKIKDHTSRLQAHPEWLELQENMAYQRPSELCDCSDFSVYESIND